MEFATSVELVERSLRSAATVWMTTATVRSMRVISALRAGAVYRETVCLNVKS